MFGKRYDGKLVKNLDGITKMMPLFMPNRMDSQNYVLFEQVAKDMDEYIDAKEKEGKKYNYMHIATAVLVRLFKMYTKLNRFIVNGRIYQRNNIEVAMVVKLSLKEGEEEDTFKLQFTGNETLDEVTKKYDEAVFKIKNGKADKTKITLGKLPHFGLKAMVGYMKWSDKHGIMPKSLHNSSPFHSSIFLTNLKSLHMDYCYHHLTNFGTNGFFVAMGKEKFVSKANDDGTVEAIKVVPFGITMDERYIDGFYYARGLKALRRILSDPSQLEKPLEEGVVFNR